MVLFVKGLQKCGVWREKKLQW